MEVKQQALDGDGRIIHGLVGLAAQSVADLAAVAVNAVADAVEEAPVLSVHRDCGQIAQMLRHGDRVRALLEAEIMQEVVSAAGGEIIELLREGHAVRVVEKAVQRAVAARDDKGRIRRERAEPGRIVADRCHIGIGKRLLREARVQSACLLRTAAVSGLRIKKHILHTVLSPFGIFKEPLIKLQERSARDFVPN